MDQVLAWIGNAILTVIASLIMLYIVYIVFTSKTNISDEDLDRISKGGDHY
jgi:hypothetical protein